MVIRIGINGFGRIGRSFFRLAAMQSNVHVVAINDLVPAENLAYLTTYDSIHGKFSHPITVEGNSLMVCNKKTDIFFEKAPSRIPWGAVGVDYVVESTGLFTELEAAKSHLVGGAKKVVISAPAKGDVPTYVMGVNHHLYQNDREDVISNASCTTNCLAPVVKVLSDEFGIEEGLMTTVHAMTATQPLQDGPSKKNLRDGRSGCLNIIPASTGAAKAVSLCLPQVKGKLTGMAFRVPVANVSAVDLTVKLTKSTDYDTLCLAMKSASERGLKGILGYTEDPVVSSDFIGDQRSSIFDKQAGIALNSTFFKLISWYDNEVGYSARLLDLVKYMHQCK